jgi:pyruvate,orthophosphate dikinase
VGDGAHSADLSTAAARLVDVVGAVESNPGDAAEQSSRRHAAVRAVSRELVEEVLHGSPGPGVGGLCGTGVPVCPGIGSGVVCTDTATALDAFERGEDVVLVLPTATPEHDAVLRVASAIVTRRGGAASHAAILARELGVPAVVGAQLDALDGDHVVVNGTTGEIRRATPETSADHRPPTAADSRQAAESGDSAKRVSAALDTVLGWADDVAEVRVLVSADTPDAAARGIAKGARGVGLFRIEHSLRAHTAELIGDVLHPQRRTPAALDVFSAVVEAQLRAVAEICDGRELTVRLLDAPTDEFAGPPETNPALGLRGARLAITAPEVTDAQLDAIAAVATRHPITVLAPLVSLPAEAEFLAARVRAAVPSARFGVTIETPRAALAADRIAPHCDVLSFGTNDLTQFTYGWGRDSTDAAFLAAYRSAGLLDADPFATLDHGGVLRLVALAAQTARAVDPSVELMLCGEHGGDDASVAAVARLGFAAVSVSADRVPFGRLSAAHASLELRPDTAGSGSN